MISRNVDVGQTVAASLQAPTLFTIAEDLRKMQVHTAVSEADVGKLAAGMPATFTVDAYPREQFHGVIRQIRDAPQTLQNVVTYDAVIDVDNDELKLKPGMTANVTFVYAERRDVLRVPKAALRFRPPAELVASGGDAGGGQGRAQIGGKSRRERPRRRPRKPQAGPVEGSAEAGEPGGARPRQANHTAMRPLSINAASGCCAPTVRSPRCRSWSAWWTARASRSRRRR